MYTTENILKWKVRVQGRLSKHWMVMSGAAARTGNKKKKKEI